MELLLDAHFWVGAAFVVFMGILVWAGVHKIAWKALGDAGAKVQAQLDEAEALRREAQDLLSQVRQQKESSERMAAEILARAQEEAERLQADAKVKLEEQLGRRGQMAERRIAQAEVQATAEVKAAAADIAARAAEQIRVARLAEQKTDPLLDAAIAQIGTRLN